MASDPDYSDFERDGADKVIENLARDAYKPAQAKLAYSWLEEQQRLSEARQALIAWRIRAAKRAAVAVLFLVLLAAILTAYLIFAGQ